MPLYLVTGPARDVVDIDDMKLHLREDRAEQDSVIESMMAAAVGHIEGDDGVYRRALIEQTWDLKLDNFPSCRFIWIPLPPLIEVVHVKYIDTDGVEQTFAEASYHVIGVGGKWRAKLQLLNSETWPTVAGQWPEAVSVRFRAGYLDESESPAVDVVPESIKQAIKLMVGHWYANRESVVVGTIVAEVPQTAEHLLSTFRVYE